MNDQKRLITAVLGLLAVVWSNFSVSAQVDDRRVSKTAEAVSLSSLPESVELRGRDACRQLLLTGLTGEGRAIDLTDVAEFEVVDPSIAKIEAGGRVLPLRDGSTEILARAGGKSIRIAVRVAETATERPVSFVNQVVPVFSKLGCNAGGCHGKASGQNGFRLSLFGFDPSLDYETLTKEDRGRRIFPAAPDQSLLLLKATGRLPHGGGKRMDPDSDEYRIVRRWIAGGVEPPKTNERQVVSIEARPSSHVARHGENQHLSVLARYDDGSSEDVTRLAQYESNETEIAAVDSTGLIHALELNGEAAIMVRYAGRVAVSRLIVPLEGETPEYRFAKSNFIDERLEAKWKALGVAPSDSCTDGEFLRRASLDLTGTLPSPERLRAFEADPDPDKRAKYIDERLETPEYADFFAHKWADILRVKRGNQQDRAHGTFSFHAWIRDSIARDLPYDRFVAGILGATGAENACPPVVWYRDLQRPEQLADDTAQVFLGLRIACAQCHHHPYEKWSQDDYWGLAAFFGRLGRKNILEVGSTQPNVRPFRQVLFTRSRGDVINKRTGKVSNPRPLDGEPISVAPEDDPRRRLIDWMIASDNPFFARAVVNRYWAHFFGRGIVEPIDDMRATNPPSNAPLLDALAEDFIAHRYSLKHLIRVICQSRAYGLSSIPNAFNSRDKQTFARHYPKRLAAEVLFDAVCALTDTPAGFASLPSDSFSPNRAISLPDESFSSYFLDVFGRPKRISGCECERVNEANLAQVLHLLNSGDIQNRVARSGARAERLAKDPRPDSEKVTELFLAALSRRPSPSQLEAALAHLSKNEKTKKTAYEDILWSLLNTKEFVFNR